MSVEIFRGCTRGCRFCQAGMITRPVRERSATHGRRDGRQRPEEDRLRGGRPAQPVAAPTTARSPTIAKGLADRYEGTETGLSLPSTRVDAFNIELANELTRNGRRSGLTFAPEGGSERMRKVINKMVTEEDLIRTVATAYGNGWRSGEALLHVRPAHRDRRGRAADRRARAPRDRDRPPGQRHARHPLHRVASAASCPSRTRRSSGPAQLDHETTDARLRKLRDAIRADRKYGKAIGFRYHDGQPGHRRGTAARAATVASAPSSSRCGATARGSTAGASTSRSTRWMAAADDARSPTRPSTSTGTPPASASRPRCCPGTTSTPVSTRTGCGRTGRTRSSEVEVEDCRWTPCFDCGVCDQMGTEIQVGPTGVTLLGMPALPVRGEGLVARSAARRPDGAAQAPVRDVAPTVQRLRLRYAKRGRLRFTSTRDFQRAFERALRRTGVPMAYSQGFNPHPRISLRQRRAHRHGQRGRVRRDRGDRGARPREGARGARRGPAARASTCSRWSRCARPDFADRLQASVWVIELPGVEPEAGRGGGRGVPRGRRGGGPAPHQVRHAHFDARGPVVRLEARDAPPEARRRGSDPADPCAILDLVVRHVTPSVRPDDVLAALRRWPTSCRRSPPG